MQSLLKVAKGLCKDGEFVYSGLATETNAVYGLSSKGITGLESATFEDDDILAILAKVGVLTESEDSSHQNAKKYVLANKDVKSKAYSIKAADELQSYVADAISKLAKTNE